MYKRQSLTNREIPIIADDYVDREFGTGCVKITPAHDFNDYEVGQRHNLPMINIFNHDAQLNDQVPEAYRGLDRFEARKRIVDDLDALGLLEKVDDHKLKVPRGDRSGVVIEPYLTDQWYVKAAPLAEKAIDAVEDGRIQFVPKQYENMYFSWMRDIQDWCISRQLWWGHRIPAWYDDQGNVYVGRNEEDVRERHNLGDTALKQDEDVLDTWFSSGLWTFGTLGWPNADNDPNVAELLKTFHPSSVLVTGFDIIFFWVARMIMMTLYFMKEVPFHTVYVHGLVRDSQGQKMSKSKGNVLDPIDLIDGIDLEPLVQKRTAGMMVPKLREKIDKQTRKEFPDGIAPYGTDALRFTYYSLASTGRDINFDVGRIEGFRNFCNKMWNATRYVLMNTEDQDCGQDNSTDYQLSLADRWILSRLQQTVTQAHEHMASYRFDLMSQAIYDFFWNEYCDWYVELSKPILWDADNQPERARAARLTLLTVLESSLRMVHPLMPFITEEIWQKIATLTGQRQDGDSIMLQPYPMANEALINESAEADIEWVKGVIVGIRNIRGEMNIPPGKAFAALLRNTSEADRRRLAENQATLLKLAKLTELRAVEDGETVPASATQLHQDMEILVPLADLIDKDEEIARLNKEIAKLEKTMQGISSKLGNEKFVAKAPAELVEKERERKESTERAMAALQDKLAEIKAL